MRKIRKFNGDDNSYVEGTASSLRDDTEDQLRQVNTDRMARMARGESGNAPAASASRSIAPAAPVAAAPKAKPAIVTLQQLNAFKAKYGADKDLRDYMNAQAGGLKRRNTVDPNMGAKADEAFSGYRKKLEAETPPTALDIANQQRKEKLNKLKIASAGAESKMRQANALNMSRADFVKGYASGGAVSASRRGDGIAQRGKTRGRMC